MVILQKLRTLSLLLGLAGIVAGAGSGISFVILAILKKFNCKESTIEFVTTAVSALLLLCITLALSSLLLLGISNSAIEHFGGSN